MVVSRAAGKLTDLVHYRAIDGLDLSALYSPGVPSAKWLLVYVHGFGGDFYSSPLVESLHRTLSSVASFASIGTRVTGYLSEIYRDTGVRYVGAAVEDFDSVELDILGFLSYAKRWNPERIALVGHSFGTNIAARFAHDHPAQIERLALLSPADSVGLQRRWEDENVAGETNDRQRLAWDLFGIVASGVRYQIPISVGGFAALLRSETFNYWSRADALEFAVPAKVIRGSLDEISNFGSIRDASAPLSTTTSTVEGAGHGFNGHEAEVSSILQSWISASENSAIDGN